MFVILQKLDNFAYCNFSDKMKIDKIISGPFDTNGYLVSDDTGEAAIIDAPLESTHIFMKHIRNNQLKVTAILLTHSHWDHTADAPELRRQTGAKIYLHADDKYRVLEPNKFTIFRLPFNLEEFSPDVELAGNEEIKVGNMSIKAIHAPGHTEGGVCYSIEGRNVIFSGDTLFDGSIGRCDLPGGSLDTLLSSIHQKLLVYPDETIIYPGHGDSTTIRNEKDNNPYLNI